MAEDELKEKSLFNISNHPDNYETIKKGRGKHQILEECQEFIVPNEFAEDREEKKTFRRSSERYGEYNSSQDSIDPQASFRLNTKSHR